MANVLLTPGLELPRNRIAFWTRLVANIVVCIGLLVLTDVTFLESVPFLAGFVPVLLYMALNGKFTLMRTLLSLIAAIATIWFAIYCTSWWEGLFVIAGEWIGCVIVGMVLIKIINSNIHYNN